LWFINLSSWILFFAEFPLVHDCGSFSDCPFGLAFACSPDFGYSPLLYHLYFLLELIVSFLKPKFSISGFYLNSIYFLLLYPLAFLSLSPFSESQI
jgi:hypothetical protein